MPKKRKKIPTSFEIAVLEKSRRRCCLCFYLAGDSGEKDGQIAHLDQNRSNYEKANLVWLCLKHHDHFDSTTSQAKGYTVAEVKRYRNKMYLELAKFDVRAEGQTHAAKSDRVESQVDPFGKALRKLPRRAMVALAVRCARRIQPLLYQIPSNWPERHNHLDALEKALATSEDSVQGTLAPGAWEPVDSVGRPLIVASADTALHALGNSEPAATAAAAVFQTAFAAWAAWSGDSEETVNRTWYAVKTAETADLRADKSMRGSVMCSSPAIVMAAAAHDLQDLFGLGLGDFPNVGRRINPLPDGPLGPLWPDGEPDWYLEALERMTAVPE